MQDIGKEVEGLGEISGADADDAGGAVGWKPPGTCGLQEGLGGGEKTWEQRSEGSCGRLYVAGHGAFA